jgi:hypothetical protein
MSNLEFGIAGIGRGQTARISVVNQWPPDPCLPAGPIRVEMTFVDVDGNRFLNQDGQPIRKVVTLEPGQASWLQINAERIMPRDDMRVELRPVARFMLMTAPPDSCTPPDPCLPTFEVIDNATGKTVLLNPGVIRGFNPQPDPPGGR